MRTLASLLLVSAVLFAQDFDVATPRGIVLKATVNMPAKHDGVAVVLAPGQGYHKDLPLLKTAAETLAGKGIIAIRFNWAYFTAGQKPSQGFVQELEDLDAVLKHTTGMKSVKKVVLAGKSLGSLVAVMRAAKKSDDIAGVALLTFPIHPAFPQSAQIVDIKVPTLVVTGNADRLCNPKELYALAARSKHPLDVVIVAGDHGFKEKQAGRTDENIALVTRVLLDWVKRR